jgi:glycosyltransferase involved in cell wall biosynthesis
MSEAALLSVVVPAYNAAATIGATLDSIHAPNDCAAIDVVVVDDGSSDAAQLRAAIGTYPDIRLVTHERNRGMCAARNSGIAASRGAFVMILDADDTLVPDWPAAFARIRARWPAESNLCFAGCRNTAGAPTMREPGFEGLVDLRTFVSERYAGEYLPVFRGDYVRAHPYIDIGTRKSCGTLSYFAWVRDAAIYVSPEVLRIYDDRRGGSVSRDWFNAAKAGESVRCLEEELARYGDMLRQLAPDKLAERWLKLAIYRRAAAHAGAWSAWRRGAMRKPAVGAASALALILGPGAMASFLALAKRLNVVKRYG